MKAKIIISYSGDFTEEDIQNEVRLTEQEIQNFENPKHDSFKVSYEIEDGTEFDKLEEDIIPSFNRDEIDTDKLFILYKVLSQRIRNLQQSSKYNKGQKEYIHSYYRELSNKMNEISKTNDKLWGHISKLNDKLKILENSLGEKG